MSVTSIERNLKSRGNFKQITWACLTLASLILIKTYTAHAQEISDPIEGVNRGIFWFNDKLDVNVLEPVARGYDDVMPDSAQTGVSNFFENLKYPKYLFSDILQFKFLQALKHTGRFVINTTVGIGGILDIAKDFGLEKHEEDFGITLAYYGVGPGPYLVLPILGPSNLRDGVGKIVDSFLDPISALGYTSIDDNIKIPIMIGAKTLDLIDTRASLLEAVDTAKQSSLDYYLFVQGAYYQYRRGVLYDGNPPEEEDVFGASTSSETGNIERGSTNVKPEESEVDAMK
jgi:phospholipid-binding lipoprotein MlaA